MKLSGKVALITGGGAGIGRDISIAFAKEGADIVIASRNWSSLNRVVDEINSIGGKALAVVTDISDKHQIREMVDKASDKFQHIDILVNNAGIAGPVITVADMDLKLWNEVLAVNLTGAMLCSKHVLQKSMIPQHSGVIINISSELGRRGLGLRSSYCASKWGIIGFTQSLAWEAGTYGIRVNCIAPGPVEGERLMRSIMEMSKALNLSVDELMNEFRVRSPLNRIVTNEEVARVALFLASDDSSGITGQTINCAAGIIMN